jgi:hypothetical protein
LLGFSLKGRLLRAWLARGNAVIANLAGDEARADFRLLRETRALTPMLVQDAAALHLLACARACRRLGGSMAEAGVFRGGTARLLCEVKGELPLHLFDVFDTLPAGPAAEAYSRHEAVVAGHFAHITRTRAAVEGLLAPYPGVHLHPGVFPQSAEGLEMGPFCFVHLDLDLPQGTRDGLEYFHLRLVEGGILIGDDYQDALVRREFDGFFAGRPDTVVALPWGQVMVVKAGAAAGG